MSVAGTVVTAAGLTDVASAIAAAGVTVPDGPLLSVVTHRVLDAHASPATILVNGRPASVATPVHGGDTVTFIAGKDRTEATRTAQVPLTLGPAASALYTNVVPGRANVVVGTVSREQVSSQVLQAPTVGHLRTPAQVALTFDDGPNGTFTTQVLWLLGTARVPAVFCVVGSHAVAQPALVAQEAGSGARLCDHTQDHPLNLPGLPPSQIAAEIADGQRSITQADGGTAPVYFRAPGGNWSAAIEADARADGMVPLRWTVDPRDWSEPGTEAIIDAVLDQLRPNGVVLLHDGGGDRSQTVTALGRLLQELGAAGWAFSLPTWVQ